MPTENGGLSELDCTVCVIIGGLSFGFLLMLTTALTIEMYDATFDAFDVLDWLIPGYLVALTVLIGVDYVHA